MSVPSKAKEICTLEHGGNVYQVAIANDNSRAYTAGADGVKLWDINSPETHLANFDPLVENSKSTHTWSLKLSPDSSIIAVGGWRNKVYIADVTSTSPVVKCELKTSAMACTALCFSADGSILYTGHNNGTVFAWDWNNQTVVHTMEGHSGYCNCIAVSADGSKLWSGGEDKTVRVWDAKEANQLEMKEMGSSIKCIAACPTQDWVVAGLNNSNLEVFSGSSPDTHTVEVDAWRINSVKFANSGSWFATTTEKGMLKGFTTPAGPSLFSVEEKKDTTSSCDISRDDTRIVTGMFGTYGKMARVYDLE